MVTVKNDPNTLLEKEGIAANLLSEAGREALNLFNRSKAVYNKFPDNPKIAQDVEQVGAGAMKTIGEDIARIKKEMTDEKEEAQKMEVEKDQSKKIIKKSEKTFDDLSLCRERLREERRRKIESGEIAPPKKKTLTSKLRDDAGKFMALIPEKLRNDKDVVKRTEKAILNFLRELKSIWGLNTIKPIEAEIKEKVSKILKTQQA